MKNWRYVLCGLVAVVAGFAVGMVSGSVVAGFVVAAGVAGVGSYLFWEFGSHGADAGNLSGEDKESEEGRYAGGYGGFHDGGGGGLG